MLGTERAGRPHFPGADHASGEIAGVPATPRRNARHTKVLVVLPAYNEEQNIGPLLDRIDEALNEERLSFTVLVVDDGSHDRTLEIIEQYREQTDLRRPDRFSTGAT